MNPIRIGVVGYSGQKFDAAAAEGYLNELLDQASAGHNSVVLVSGLTDMGIPALAYRIAARRGWRTAGVACAKASKYPCYPVDEKHIIGDNWGDESQTFLGLRDILVRVGGGAQSLAETRSFANQGGKVLEADLLAQRSPAK